MKERSMEKLTNRQQEIIDKAIRLIDEKGIQGLTIKNLAREIGVTEGAIYRHFETKKQILISILTLFHRQVHTFREAAHNPRHNTYDKLYHMLYHFGGYFQANPAIVSVIFAEEIFQNDNELSQEIAGIIHEIQQFLLGMIQEGQQNGEIRNDLDAMMIVTGVLGPFRLIVKKWKMEGFAVSLEDSLEDFLNYLKATLFS